MLAIAEFLCSHEFDVVCLQELWTDRDYQLICNRVSSVLQYAHHFYSGVTGSGICILSKHQIEETFFHQWSVNGYIHEVHHGDWWGGKGVGLCRLKVESGADTFFVNVYSAHLHAEYNRASDDYQAHRVLQAYDTGQFILLTSSSADLIVLAGDLNTEPGDLSYRAILNMPGMTDAYMQSGNLSQDMYATSESYRNSYTSSSLIKDKVLGQRIDYIMYHPGSNVKVDLKNYCLPLPERVPNKSYSYSDHEAVMVELSISREKKSKNMPDNDRIKRAVLEEGIVLCEEAEKNIARRRVLYWLGVILSFSLLLLSLIVPAVVNTSYRVLFSVFRIVLTVLAIFCLLMATLWSKIEMHGVRSGKLAMQVSLKKLQKNQGPFELIISFELSHT